METISPISTPQIALFFGFYTPIDFPLKTSLIQSLFRLHTVKLHFRNKREDETTSRDRYTSISKFAIVFDTITHLFFFSFRPHLSDLYSNNNQVTSNNKVTSYQFQSNLYK